MGNGFGLDVGSDVSSSSVVLINVERGTSSISYSLRDMHGFTTCQTKRQIDKISWNRRIVFFNAIYRAVDVEVNVKSCMDYAIWLSRSFMKYPKELRIKTNK